MKKIKRLNPAGQIVISFLVIILIGAILLSLPISSNNGEWLPFIDSLFTATSAVCVTGLIVVDTAVHFSLFGQIVVILLIQIGGLGFITISALVFLLLGKKISFKNRIAIQESLNQDSNQGVVNLVKKIIILVFTTEFVGFLCLLPSFISIYGVGKGIFTSAFLAISAFCNAGFDCIGTQETAFQNMAVLNTNPFVLIPIMILIVIGGIGYIVMFELFGKTKGKKLSIHSKIVLSFTSILIFGGALLFLILEWNNPLTIGNMSIGNKILNAFFQSITPRTAGFASFDQAGLTSGGVVLTDILMFIGGSPASVAGGVKTTTIVVLLFYIFKQPNNNDELVVFKRKISSTTIKKSSKIFSMAILIITTAVLLLSILEPSLTLSSIIFEVLSAISTVGITLGITTKLCTLSKIIVAMLMFIGRVGALTITVALSNKNKSKSEDIEYLDSKIMVG